MSAPTVRARPHHRDLLLSRAAASVYWAGRYLERAEATARVVKIHTELFLDLPREAGVGWAPLLAVTGTEEAYASGHAGQTEEDVISFLTIDRDNPGSVLCSLDAARENFRVTRAIVPVSGWEVLNRLYGWANASAADAVGRRSRLAWMDHVVAQCQLLDGVLSNMMSHDAAYSFLRAGRFLERADMTTRVLDVQAAVLTTFAGPGGPSSASSYGDVTWMAVLRSLSAHQMYRRAVGEVSGPEALRFLLWDRAFPRAVAHCLAELTHAFAGLPRGDAALDGCASVQETLITADLDRLAEVGLHAFADALQAGIASVHDALAATYFVPPSAAGVV